MGRGMDASKMHMANGLTMSVAEGPNYSSFHSQ